MKISRHDWTGNRTSRRVLAGVCLAFSALLGCSGGSGPTAIEIPISRIDITQPCNFVIVDTECQIVALAFAEDGRQIGNPVLRFVSTNSGAADVTTRGLVIGRAAGTASIFVMNSTGSVSEQFRVDVIPRSIGR